MPTVIGAPCGSAALTTVKPAVAARAGAANPARARAVAEARRSERIDMGILGEWNTAKVLRRSLRARHRVFANGRTGSRTGQPTL
jgi:hypothetical protein